MEGGDDGDGVGSSGGGCVGGCGRYEEPRSPMPNMQMQSWRNHFNPGEQE